MAQWDQGLPDPLCRIRHSATVYYLPQIRRVRSPFSVTGTLSVVPAVFGVIPRRREVISHGVKKGVSIVVDQRLDHWLRFGN